VVYSQQNTLRTSGESEKQIVSTKFDVPKSAANMKAKRAIPNKEAVKAEQINKRSAAL
jgi:hypothetical protein